MRLHLYAALVATTLFLAACGGASNDAINDAFTDTTEASSEGGDAAGTEGGEGAEGGGVSEERMPFDAGALGNETLNVVHLRPLDRSGPTPPPPVTPVIDTCAALATADFDAIVNEVATKYSFGEEPKFVATSLGAACDYRSDTHVLRVLVGSADQVSTATDSPGLMLPIGAGDVSETVSPDDGAVTILAEDSFGLDTPFAAFTESGSYGVMVSNLAGTGIDYGSTGALYARLASAASAGVANAPSPSAEAQAQMETVAADPCSVWTVTELDAFLIDEAIERALGDITDVCRWNSDWTVSEIKLEALPQGATADDSEPIAADSPISIGPRGRVFVDTGDAILRIDVSKAADEGISYDGIDAAVALAENIVARLS